MNICCDVPLPLLSVSKFLKKIDLEIKHDPELKLASKDYSFSCKLDRTILNYPNSGSIELSNHGRLIRYNSKKLDLNFLSKIINHGIGYSIYQRRDLALHAGAINTKKGAVLFLGQSGAGKSSLVAALSKRFELITDDTLAIDFTNGTPKTYPGIGYFKIENKMAASLGFHKKAFSFTDDRGRSYYQSHKSANNKSKIIGCYILKWGDENIIEDKLKLQDKIGVLLSSAYTSFPINSCPDSASMLLRFSEKFLKNVRVFTYTRKKGQIDNTTSILFDHMNTSYGLK